MWIDLTAADFAQKIGSSEYGSVLNAQLPEGVTGAAVLAEEIRSTIKMVGGYVAAHAPNVLGVGDTIPEELKDAALAVVRFKVFTRIPGLKRLLDEPRMKEYDNALVLLRDVAGGRFAVVPPETPSADQAVGQTAEVVSSRARQHTREKWSGVL